MKTLFSHLFTRPQSPRGAARPVRRRTPLGVAALDDRILPSVTPGLVNGQLQLVGNAGNDLIAVSASTQLQIVGFLPKLVSVVRVDANFADGSATKTWDSASVKSLLFSAGGGTDTFVNNTILEAEFNGKGGSATMTGGFGRNTFWTDGDDPLLPRGVNNVTFGFANSAFGRLSPEELGARGSLGVSLFKNQLFVTGPGGAGFRIAGNWKSDGAAAETFTASGTMALMTPWGTSTSSSRPPPP